MKNSTATSRPPGTPKMDGAGRPSCSRSAYARSEITHSDSRLASATTFSKNACSTTALVGLCGKLMMRPFGLRGERASAASISPYGSSPGRVATGTGSPPAMITP